MNNLPFTLDPEYDYILTDADRHKFAPKLATDEIWIWRNTQWVWELYGPGGGLDFMASSFYRRRKTIGWVSVETRLPDHDRDVLFVARGKLYLAPLTNPKTMWSSITHWTEPPALPHPPKPAAEVAYDIYANSFGANVGHKGTWLAAIEWAKDHKEAL